MHIDVRQRLLAIGTTNSFLNEYGWYESVIEMVTAATAHLKQINIIKDVFEFEELAEIINKIFVGQSNAFISWKSSEGGNGRPN